MQQILILLLILLLIIYYIIINKSETITEQFNQSQNKTLVMYCYLEDGYTQPNFNYFIKAGIINSKKYDYVILINNGVNTSIIPDYPNIKVIINKDNNPDLYTYKVFIKNMLNENSNFFNNYSYFYFINSSCRGPFLPVYETDNFIEIINRMLINYDYVAPIVDFPYEHHGFVYLNINKFKNIPFLHTYMFAMNTKAFELFLNLLPELTSHKDSNLLIERKMSSYFLVNNLKLKSLLLRFNNFNLNDELLWDAHLWNTENGHSDYETPNNYFGIDINPLEVIFVKNIRKIHETRTESKAFISEQLNNQINKYTIWK